MFSSYKFAPILLATSLVSFCTLTLAHADSGITGRVAGQSEEGKYLGMIAGARIEALGPGGDVVASTSSNAKGQFKLSLSPGRFFYRVKAEGYRDEDAGRGFEIKRADQMEVFHFALTRGENDPDRVPAVIPEPVYGTLAGRVLQRTDEGDVGVEHAKITLVNEETRQVEEVIVRPGMSSVGHEGSYRVTLPEGSWRASVRAPRFDRYIDPEPIRIMTGKMATRDFVLRKYDPPEEMLASQGIRGQVVIKKGGRTYPPPFNVQLVARNSSDSAGMGSALTEISEQDFSIKTMPGSYRVEAVPADEEFVSAISRQVFVFPGRESTVRIVLRPKPRETELAETEVRQREIDMADSERDRTDMRDLPGEETRLGPQPEPPDLEIVALDRRTKKPLAETEILLREVTDQKATVISGRTGSDGIATFKLPEGQYFVVARLAGFEVVAAMPETSFLRGRLVLDVSTKTKNRATFVLDRHREPEITPVISPQVQVNVFDQRTRRPLPGARINLQRSGSGGATAATGTTSPTGQVTLGLRSAGDYLANISVPGYIPRRMELTAIAGRITVLHAAMQRSGESIEPGGPKLVTVNGWVVTPRLPSRGFSGDLTPRRPPLPGESTPDWGLVQPVAGANILWYFPNEGTLPGAVRTVQTNSKGRFTIEDLRENNYPVMVRASGYNELPSRINVRVGMRDPVLLLKPSRPDTPTVTPSGRTATLNVIVIDQSRRPVAGAGGDH